MGVELCSMVIRAEHLPTHLRLSDFKEKRLDGSLSGCQPSVWKDPRAEQSGGVGAFYVLAALGQLEFIMEGRPCHRSCRLCSVILLHDSLLRRPAQCVSMQQTYKCQQ